MRTCPPHVGQSLLQGEEETGRKQEGACGAEGLKSPRAGSSGQGKSGAIMGNGSFASDISGLGILSTLVQNNIIPSF